MGVRREERITTSEGDLVRRVARDLEAIFAVVPGSGLLR